MLFIKTDDLKNGMRLARPIYNKNGVLLYERNSKLTEQSILSVKNFGLIGIFILEPAEPVPPMTRDDLDFERFQTMTVFSLQEELDKMVRTRKSIKIQVIAASIIKSYGNLNRKINFIQNLRSAEDVLYKHSLNVAILSAMITHVMNVRLEEQLDAVLASLVHDISGVMARISRPNAQPSDLEGLFYKESMELIDIVFSSNPSVKRTCLLAQKTIDDFEAGRKQSVKMTTSAKVVAVAEYFDSMTAMKLGAEPASEVMAVKALLENPEVFDERVVDALIHSINILNPGTCVELNTGEKGLVLTSNTYNILRPMVLGFRDNMIIDLNNEMIYGDIEIVDIMKTMDNRYIMDTEILKKRGISFEEQEYVQVKDF
ncbi:MAG: phosphohydrolase [Lachnospiraceae bacterium]|nr:phosphohydrolase [Lachnospiraceae bacterium]MDD3659391.1 phosphohydrolase [Lachnospiraceae bacterium]